MCGSRGWKDPDPIHMVFAELEGICIRRGEELVLIHGDAKGADRMAADIATQYNAKVIAVPADWEEHGKAAGPIRNQKMLDDHNPDVVWAFRSTGKSNGTDDMVRRSKKAGILTHVWSEGQLAIGGLAGGSCREET